MARPELEKARVRLYEKADRRRVLLAVSTVLLLLFGFIAFLNVIGSVNISFREGQRNFDRFLNWLVIDPVVPRTLRVLPREEEPGDQADRAAAPRLPAGRRGGGPVRHDPRGGDRRLLGRPGRAAHPGGQKKGRPGHAGGARG